MVKINETCIGCGACVSVCSDGYEMGDDGKSHVLNEKAPCIKAGADACPVQAIEL